MREEKNWYIVYTKSKLEKRVAELLEKKQIPTYLPEMSKLQYLFGRKRIMKVPLIPSLLFVFSDEQTLSKVITTDGVAGVLYKFQKPATIRSREIITMQRFLTEYDDVTIEKVPLGYTGEDFSGTSILQDSNFQEKNFKEKKIFLPSIGYSLCTKSEEIVLHRVA